MKTRYALAVAVILILVFELTLMRSGAQYQYGSIRTGSYNGTGANVTIQIGLTETRAFFVTELAARGPSAQGYTTPAYPVVSTDHQI